MHACKDFLYSILTTARSLSFNNKWKDIISETYMENMHLISKKSNPSRDSEVGEPPPFGNACPTTSNPHPSPAEDPNYVSIGPGYQYKNLYKYVKHKVADLHRRFKKANWFCQCENLGC